MNVIPVGYRVIAISNGRNYRPGVLQVGTRTDDRGFTNTMHDYREGDIGTVAGHSNNRALNINFDNGLYTRGCSVSNFVIHNSQVNSGKPDTKVWATRRSNRENL
jgi:hypothetical protein